MFSECRTLYIFYVATSMGNWDMLEEGTRLNDTRTKQYSALRRASLGNYSVLKPKILSYNGTMFVAALASLSLKCSLLYQDCMDTKKYERNSYTVK